MTTSSCEKGEALEFSGGIGATFTVNATDANKIVYVRTVDVPELWRADPEGLKTIDGLPVDKRLRVYFGPYAAIISQSDDRLLTVEELSVRQY